MGSLEGEPIVLRALCGEGFKEKSFELGLFCLEVRGRFGLQGEEFIFFWGLGGFCREGLLD